MLVQDQVGGLEGRRDVSDETAVTGDDQRTQGIVQESTLKNLGVIRGEVGGCHE
jgi:hypothetical protein